MDDAIANKSRATTYAAYALRSRSPLAIRTIFDLAGCRDASRLLDTKSAHSKKSLEFEAGLTEFEVPWILATARVAALHPELDSEIALQAFEFVANNFGLEHIEELDRDLYAQVLLTTDRASALDSRIRDLQLSQHINWSLRADLENSVYSKSYSYHAWQTIINEAFVPFGIAPLELKDTASVPQFSALTSKAPTSTSGGQLVSVIMPVYQPSEDILIAVDSILRQSWTDLELLIIDDGSSTDHNELFSHVVELDERIRFIRQENNRGTYTARNTGIAAARGEYVAFQDADDWSHPQRLELQLQPLEDDQSLLATRGLAARVYDDLTFTYPGYSPIRENASSLVYRTKAVTDLIGYFDFVRKSADTEFPRRLQAVAPGTVMDLKDAPLSITQLTNGSLSRTDAIPGWTRWNRIAYRDSYRAWHREIRVGASDPRIQPGSPRKFPLPDHSFAPQASKVPAHRADIVFVADWSRDIDLDRNRLADIHALVANGMRVGVSHVELSNRPRLRIEGVPHPIAALVNNGVVTRTSVEKSETPKVLAITQSNLLQHFDPQSVEMRPERVLILAEGDATDNSLLALAEELFETNAYWIDESDRPRTSSPLPPYLKSTKPLATPADPFKDSKGARPVIGIYLSPSNSVPKLEHLLALLPDDDAFDVRIIGNRRAIRKKLRKYLAPNWQVMDHSYLLAGSLFPSLDVCVFPGAIGKATAAALAASLESGVPALVCDPDFGPAPGVTKWKSGDPSARLSEYLKSSKFISGIDSIYYPEQQRAALQAWWKALWFTKGPVLEDAHA